MNVATIGTTQARTQAATAKILATLPPQPAIERQAQMLCQRFALAPEVARVIAALVFAAAEART
jgi:hypothetical protein